MSVGLCRECGVCRTILNGRPPGRPIDVVSLLQPCGALLPRTFAAPWRSTVGDRLHARRFLLRIFRVCPACFRKVGKGRCAAGMDRHSGLPLGELHAVARRRSTPSLVAGPQKHCYGRPRRHSRALGDGIARRHSGPGSQCLPVTSLLLSSPPSSIRANYGYAALHKQSRKSVGLTR